MEALNTLSSGGPDHGPPPQAAGLSAPELRSFLELGASQLEAAIKEADSRVDALTQSVTAVAAHGAAMEQLIASLDASDPAALDSIRASARALSAQMADATHHAIVSLQFYDKMIQRLTHVRDGLAIPAETVERSPVSGSAAWEGLLDRVRSRYSMVEERVLFDFLLRGTGPDQMLRALTDLRSAEAGELDLF